MTVTIYTSTDASAPAALANSAGALIAILDACLVNGYGSKAASGWTKVYSGTNLAVYKQGTGSNAMYVRVDDLAGSIARIRGYETMSDVNTGTGPFPTDAQVSGGGYIYKHDATAGTRKWIVAATAKAFWFWTQFDTTVAASNAGITFFGDIASVKVGDVYNTMLMAATSNAAKNNASPNVSYDHGGIWSAINQGSFGHFMARSYSQTGTSINVGKRADTGRFSHTNLSRVTTYGFDWLWNLCDSPLPNVPDGGLYLAPLAVHEPSVGYERGVMPGVWALAHSATGWATYDTFTGSGAMAGKTFQLVPIYGMYLAIETSNTW